MWSFRILVNYLFDDNRFKGLMVEMMVKFLLRYIHIFSFIFFKPDYYLNVRECAETTSILY